MNPVTTSELTSFCEKITEASNAHYAKHYPNLSPPRYYPDPRGRKYVRIVREETHGSGRSVLCFVERSTGDIWKAAGWKAPALNFPRGNVRGDTSYATRLC